MSQTFYVYNIRKDLTHIQSTQVRLVRRKFHSKYIENRLLKIETHSEYMSLSGTERTRLTEMKREIFNWRILECIVFVGSSLTWIETKVTTKNTRKSKLLNNKAMDRVYGRLYFEIPCRLVKTTSNSCAHVTISDDALTAIMSPFKSKSFQKFFCAGELVSLAEGSLKWFYFCQHCHKLDEY